MSHGRDLFEQSGEAAYIIWRWLGFSPRLFMGLETAYLVISFFPWGRRLHIASLISESLQWGTTVLNIWGYPWSPLTALRLPAPENNQRHQAERGPWAGVVGCGLRLCRLDSLVLEEELPEGTAGLFTHRLRLDSLSRPPSPPAVFLQLLGKVML